jgi:hypothetical protein
MIDLISDKTLEKRFYSKIKVNLFDIHGCHIWTSTLSEGYGLIKVNGINTGAHRVAYLLHYGFINHRQIDHTCKNTKCVNPLHLELVTQQVNLSRGNSSAAKNNRKTHCKNGHLFDKLCRGKRVCSICSTNRIRKFRGIDVR